MRLFQLLGVPDAATAAARFTTGVAWGAASPLDLTASLFDWLDAHVTVRNVRAGAGNSAIALQAELHVDTSVANGPSIAVPQMPEFRLLLRSTGSSPARLFVLTDGTATPRTEVVIERLPVELRLPPGFIEPLGATPDDRRPADDSRRSGAGTTLRYQHPSSVLITMRIRRTPLGEIVYEPALPLSFGPCRFLGLFPCKSLHHLQLFPSASLAGDPEARELALEWTRHPIPPVPHGVVTARTLDLDLTYPPLDRFASLLRGSRPDAAPVELVVEDLAFPVASATYLAPPIPLHGRVGIRRDRSARPDRTERSEWDLAADPIAIDIGDYKLMINSLMLQTPAPPDYQPILVDLALGKRGRPAPDPLARTTPPRPAPPAPVEGAAVTITVDDEWTLILGVRDPLSARTGERTLPGTTTTTTGPGPDPTTTTTRERTVRPPGLVLFELGALKLAVTLLAGRIGASISRIVGAARGEPLATGPAQWFVAQFDLGVARTTLTETSQHVYGDPEPFAVTTTNNRPFAAVFSNLGWYLGRPTFEGLQLPGTAELRLFRVLVMSLDEIGWVAEPNGGTYFAISGGITIDWGAGAAGQNASGRGASPPPRREGSSSSGSAGESLSTRRAGRFGISVDRLRFRTGGNPSAPAFLLDGVTLDLQVGPFGITGFGRWRDETLDTGEATERRVRELDVGLRLRFPLAGNDLDLGARFLRGSVDHRTHPERDFTFGLLSVGVTPLPVGPVQLTNLRFLVASNLAPALGASHPAGPNLRLLAWFNANEDALIVPRGRSLAAWRTEPGTLSIGGGFGVAFPAAQMLRIDAFAFYTSGPAAQELLVLVRVYLLRGERPVAYGALDYDVRSGRWGFLLGVDLNLGTLLGIPATTGIELFRLSGTLYAGNQPATFALGRIRDRSSWLTLLLNFPWVVFQVRLEAGLCLEVVEDGPVRCAFGFYIGGRLYATLGIAELEAYAAFGLLVGTWSNESKASGWKIWGEAGARIRLFWIFNFGLGVRFEFERLGSSPSYRRLFAEFALELPFFLPSIRWTLEHVWERPVLDEITALSPPLIGASALGATALALPVTPVRPGDTLDPRRVYAARELPTTAAALAPGPAPEPVATDAAIALDFKVTLDDHLAIGEDRPRAESRQPGDDHDNQVWTTYELIALSVARRPRGSSAPLAPLLDPTETALYDEATGEPSGTARFESALAVDWDADCTRAGALDPRRLLLNARTPFTYAIAAPRTDEGLAHAEPGWPCHAAPVEDPRRAIDLAALPHGRRAPRQLAFAPATSRLTWRLAPPPVIAAGGARLPLRPGTADVLLADLAFDELARRVEVKLTWSAAKLGSLILVGYRGAAKVADVAIPLDGPPPALLVLEHAPGLTAAQLVHRAATFGQDHTLLIDVREVAYVSRAIWLSNQANTARAAARAARRAEGRGALAWLPHHEYEVAARVKIAITHKDTTVAPQVRIVEQRTRFETRGVLGLNAVDAPGRELRPYVELVDDTLVYRDEPIALAFSPDYNQMFPLAAAGTSVPAERQQLIEYVLAVSESAAAGQTGRREISQTSADWLTAHAGLPTTAILAEAMTAREVRAVHSLDPRTGRLRAMQYRAGACEPTEPASAIPRSEVLVHRPGPDGLWTAARRLEVHLRLRGAPFVEREAFAAADLAAFDLASPAWTLDDRALRAAGPSHAAFGEPTWDHVAIETVVAPAAGSSAGVIVGLGGAAAMLARVAQPAGDAAPVLELLRGTPASGWTAVATSAPLAARAERYQLAVTQYDDRVRLEVAGVRIEAPRAGITAGRAALWASAGAAFESLRVRGLDAMRGGFRSSRYRDLADHVASFTGDPLIADASAAEAAAFTAAAASLTTPATTAVDRHARFTALLGAAPLFLRPSLDALAVSALCSSGGVLALLVESPEPLPFASDLTLTLDVDGAPRPVRVISDETEHRALIIPVAPCPRGLVAAHLTLARRRYRGDRDETVYRATATLAVDLRAREVFRHTTVEVSGNVAPIPAATLDGRPTALALLTAVAGGPLGAVPLGVYYTGTRWAAYTQTLVDFPANAALHVATQRGHLHVATAANTTGPATRLDPTRAPLAAGAVIATAVWNPPGSPGIYVTSPIAVRETATHWELVAADGAPLPLGCAFAVHAAPDGIRHVVERRTLAGAALLEHPRLDGRPDALPFAMLELSGPLDPTTALLGVCYDSAFRRWTVACLDATPLPEHTRLHLWIP